MIEFNARDGDNFRSIRNVQDWTKILNSINNYFGVGTVLPLMLWLDIT